MNLVVLIFVVQQLSNICYTVYLCLVDLDPDTW